MSQEGKWKKRRAAAEAAAAAAAAADHWIEIGTLHIEEVALRSGGTEDSEEGTLRGSRGSRGEGTHCVAGFDFG